MTTPRQTIRVEWELPNAQHLYRVLDLIALERARKASAQQQCGFYPDMASPDVDMSRKIAHLTILLGQAAEVCDDIRICNERNLRGRDFYLEGLRERLITLAAETVAMVESLEPKPEGRP